MELSQLGLEHHLQYNHYPPVSLEFVPVAKEAIDKANDGEWDTTIDMPNGKSLSVIQIVEGLHLDFFIEEVQ